jgi:hypothetical protein
MKKKTKIKITDKTLKKSVRKNDRKDLKKDFFELLRRAARPLTTNH